MDDVMEEEVELEGVFLEEEVDSFVVPKPVSTLVSVDLSPEEKGVGRSVLKVRDLARDAGWPFVRLHSSLVHTTDEFYAGDSKKKPGQEQPDHSKGDMKKPAHDTRHWWVQAAQPAIGLGFQAHWKEGVTPKGGRSFGFVGALCKDPIGMPVEFFVDYSFGADDLKQVKDEPAHIHHARVLRLNLLAKERDVSYNDGTSWLDTEPRFTSFGDFESWLTEALQVAELAVAA